MAKSNHRYVFKIVMTTITAGLIAFAFIHSSMPADVSAEESENVLQFLTDFFKLFGIQTELTDYIVRKSAHFTEFSAIGLMLMNTAYAFNKSRPYRFYPHILFVGLLTAVIDETIQLNVVGRSGQVTDVLLDFSGIVFGSLLMLIIITIHKKIHHIR